MVGSEGSHGDGPNLLTRNRQNYNDNEDYVDDEGDDTSSPSPSPGSGPSPGSRASTQSLANRTHTLVFALVQRNLLYLESFLWSVSDPDSPRYGQYMSKEEVQQTTPLS